MNYRGASHADITRTQNPQHRQFYKIKEIFFKFSFCIAISSYVMQSTLSPEFEFYICAYLGKAIKSWKKLSWHHFSVLTSMCEWMGAAGWGM